VIYLDTSVVLAYLLQETPGPTAGLFGMTVVSSRLLEYEVWNRLHPWSRGVRRCVSDGLRRWAYKHPTLMRGFPLRITLAAGDHRMIVDDGSRIYSRDFRVAGPLELVSNCRTSR